MASTPLDDRVADSAALVSTPRAGSDHSGHEQASNKKRRLQIEGRSIRQRENEIVGRLRHITDNLPLTFYRLMKAYKVPDADTVMKAYNDNSNGRKLSTFLYEALLRIVSTPSNYIPFYIACNP